MSLQIAMAKKLMRLAPRHVGESDYTNSDFYKPERLEKLSQAELDAALFKAAEERRKIEMEDRFLERFFGPEVRRYLEGRTVLDFGCFMGGTAIAWMDLYGIKKALGFDVHPLYARGANQYAKQVGYDAEFIQGFGEKLDYADKSMDTIVAIDVFEHVYDVEACMKECWRMLKPGGYLITIFPPYYHPVGHHLKVSYMPMMHHIFNGDVLRRAQNELFVEKGAHYEHFQAEKNPHYVMPGLNGMSARRFRGLVKAQGWGVVEDVCKGVPTIGRRAQTPLFRTIRGLTSILARVPVIEETFRDRVAMVLKRPDSA